MRLGAIPSGYSRADLPDAVVVVARTDVLAAVVGILRGAPPDAATLHAHASRAPGARVMQGREAAYAVEIAGRPVVVRHNRHGGAFRGLTGDLFAAPTRAPRELELSTVLTRLGIPTPTVLAIAIYPAPLGLARSDVMTEEVMRSTDFANVVARTTPGSAERTNAWQATFALLSEMARAGVRHHDLNAKNVLLAGSAPDAKAYLLDVDRTEVGLHARDAAEANVARLERSLLKWRSQQGAQVSDEELSALRRTVTNTL